MAYAADTGPRLEFVLRELTGTVKRRKHRFDKEAKQIVSEDVLQPAGYMLYLADGHSYRLTADQVRKRGFNREPAILNLEKANDPKTPAGRFKLAITESARRKAYTEMEQEIISVAESFAGNAANYIADYDPKGKVAS